MKRDNRFLPVVFFVFSSDISRGNTNIGDGNLLTEIPSSLLQSFFITAYIHIKGRELVGNINQFNTGRKFFKGLLLLRGIPLVLYMISGKGDG